MPEIAKIEVVVNKCYGGYGISRLAAAELIRRGHPKAVAISEELGVTADALDSDTPKNIFSKEGTDLWSAIYRMQCEIPRHDTVLVEIVRELGEKANGDCAELRIEELRLGYNISDDDGIELLGGYGL